MKKILTIIGARPQIIKAAAISRAIKNNFSTQLKEILVHTGQHYDNNMSDVFFGELGIPKPDFLLSIGSDSHGSQTGKMLIEIEKIILAEKPDAVVVYGDTNSTIAGSLAAVKLHVPVVHIEAGLRSRNKKMPEEINRIATDHFSTLLFSPTLSGVENLKAEGFEISTNHSAELNAPKVFHCGDIMFDNSMFYSKVADEKASILKQYHLVPNQFVLSTVHRPSNTDAPENLTAILSGLQEISEKDQVKIVFPIHPRTKHKIAELLAPEFWDEIQKHIVFIEPVGFLEMIQLEKNAKLIVTDSGGVQKEAYFFQKKCVIMREETEWVEIVEQKAAQTVGANQHKMVNAYFDLLNTPCSFPPIFGDGKSAEFICEKILEAI